MQQLVLATRNKGKIRELSTLLSDLPLTVLSLDDLTSVALKVEETGTTYEENALLKANAIADATGLSCLADDSGISVNALDGRPGVYSARYVVGSDEDRCEALLKEMKGRDDRKAQFVAVVAYVDPVRKISITFKGVCEGSIAHSTQGLTGFGYDPIFIPTGYEQTMAQLGQEIKNSLSHRRKALEQFKNWLRKQS